jgi:hypothetical protein
LADYPGKVNTLGYLPVVTGVAQEAAGRDWQKSALDSIGRCNTCEPATQKTTIHREFNTTYPYK